MNRTQVTNKSRLPDEKISMKPIANRPKIWDAARMQSTQETDRKRTYSTPRVPRTLLDGLAEIEFPPGCGATEEARVQYAVAHFIEEFRRARKPADTRK